MVRNILGQVRAKVSLPFMMNTGRIFIANLSKGSLGADKANLLGSLLTTQRNACPFLCIIFASAARRAVDGRGLYG